MVAPSARPEGRGIGAAPPRLTIRGHSGSHLSVVAAGSSAVLVKSVGDGLQAHRLQRQIAKQRRARLDNRLPSVRIPAILEEGEVDGRYAATMEYVYFQDPIEHLNGASTVAVRRVAEMLLGYVDMELERSTTTDVSTDVVGQKLDDIEAALVRDGCADGYAAALDAARRRLGSTSSLALPVGPCHGDLTLSNVLFSHDSTAIALVDFLDSFLESPLIDLAKLRQDTRFGWTALMADVVVDRVRFDLVMAHLDGLVEERFGGRAWYDEHVDLLTAVCLLRIAPYATTSAVHRFLASALTTIRL